MAHFEATVERVMDHKTRLYHAGGAGSTAPRCRWEILETGPFAGVGRVGHCQAVDVLDVGVFHAGGVGDQVHIQGFR